VKKLALSYSDDWREWLATFTSASNSDSFLDLCDQARLTDEMLRQRALELPGLSQKGVSGLPVKEQRDDAIRILKKEGFGLRQIARVTGIPYGIVRSR